MSEFIYVLENPSMPGLVKIGRTERSVSKRVGELSAATGVPTGFVMVKEYAVTDSVEAEGQVHERLSGYRVSDNREFFKMSAEEATEIIESILGAAEQKVRRDFEWEDELVARAIPIVVKEGMARPRMLEELLGISYEDALFVIQVLRGRGVIDERNESKWRGDSSPFSSVSQPESIPPLEEDQELIEVCIEVVRSEQKASVSLLQRRLRLSYTRAARVMDELERRGVVGPSKGAEPRDILPAFDGAGTDGSTPAEEPPVIRTHWVVCFCQHCGGKIEFDEGELGDRQSVSIPCPHCDVETLVSNAG